MPVELTEQLLAKAAGWEAMKQARAYLEQGNVLSSFWEPPLLRGVVQAGETSFRAAMVIKSAVDIENLCTCREARQWGKICAHGVSVGLHHLKPPTATPQRSQTPIPGSPPVKPNPRQSRSAIRHQDDGEPARLKVVLPPNFDQSVLRGKVVIAFEAECRDGNFPLNTLPKHRTHAFSTTDRKAIEHIETLAQGETPGLMQMETSQLATLLSILGPDAQLSLGKSKSVTVATTPFPIPLRATLEPTGEISLHLKPGATLPAMLGPWVWKDHTFHPLGLPPSALGLLQAPVRIPRHQIPSFLSQQWPQLREAPGLESNFQPGDFTLEPQAPRFILELKGGMAQLAARLQCAYGSRIMTLGVTAPHEAVWLPDPDIVTRYSTRDTTAEREALNRLQRSGFSGPDTHGNLQLLGQNAVLAFFAREFPRLQRDWQVDLEERLQRSTTQNLERIEPQFKISSGVQWFDLGVVFTSTGGETFSPTEIQRLLLSGQSHTKLRNGKTAVIDTGAVEELQEVLLDCAPQQNAQGYRIQNNQAGFLESTLGQHPGWKIQAPRDWRERATQQRGDTHLTCPPLDDLEPVLRPYQKHGVAWMRFLRENGFGGILADEMGLGKTLQALAFLRHKRRTAPAGQPPDLIVCPTSLVFNWLAEATRFTPDLKILSLHGPDRHTRFEDIPTADMVLTSYALLRRDADRYRALEFDTVILDEAQHIKNRQTQNAQAVKAVRSTHRLVLTGTPMENSVQDLWSIFDFLMPGYLGSAKDFRERYELPIAKEKNAEAQTRLARRLRPFLLRRLKRDVASDLPAKLEQVSYCDLSRDQKALYEQLLQATRKEVLEAAGPQGLARGRILVLTALLRLRQICCDPRLLRIEDPGTPAESGNDPSPRAAMPSGKLELFSELLEEVLDGGHRVLVFSQFVGMLSLLKERLEADGVDYCYLDGSTSNRAEVVTRFQSRPEIPVFLISLKAGGVGLNLTGADTVIHFDPWWNPAVEDQATDRAHRIGQTRVVTSYKLITRETVEEKILILQNRKREMIQATMGGDESFAASLSWDEIQELLS